MDNESYQDKIDHTVLIFADIGTQTEKGAICTLFALDLLF